MQDPITRRALLLTLPNPEPRRDAMIRLRARVPATGAVGAAEVILHYVPDKLIVSPHGWRDFIENGMASVAFPSLEAMTAAVLDDLLNELVPRWLGVHTQALSVDGAGHEVILEDHQPAWSNPALLSRFRMI